jgi:hypothetical protein
MKAVVGVLLLGSFLSFTTPKAFAFEGVENKSEKVSNGASAATSVPATADSKSVKITPSSSDAEFESAPRGVQPGATFKQVLRVHLNKSVASFDAFAPDDEAAPEAVPVPTPKSKEPLTTIPMTVGEKFNYFFKGSFLSVGAYGNAAFSGIRGEAFDKDHDPNGVHGNYFADAGTRAARSFAFGTTSRFFTRFAYASIFRQDPRYHRSGKQGAGARIAYAVSRVFITQGDKGGSQFNISFLGGGLTTAYISKLWEREERKTTKKIMTRWATNISFTALANIVKEFLSGQ